MAGIESFYRTHNRLLRATKLDIVRDYYQKIDWRDRLICLKGARGVGKSTLLLQRVKLDKEEGHHYLYVSLDNFWFTNHTLEELADYHVSHGGTHIMLDEVHRLPLWQTCIKNLYDSYPELSIVYTGSSLLEIDMRQGDLSRRQMVYNLPGLSFREYLRFEGVGHFPAVDLDTLLREHEAIANEVMDHTRVLPHFERYLTAGYYPFYREAKAGYGLRLQEVMRQVLESDLQIIGDVQYSTIVKLKKLLLILAERVPQTPNMSDLYRELETNREQGLKMLYALDKAQLVALLSRTPRSYKQLSKPDKIYLDNPNLMEALTPSTSIGTLRETFFYNQLRSACHQVTLPPKGDFLVDGRLLFEVGGRGKTFDQIKDQPDSYLALADTETGHHNRIPLWLFGWLY